MKKKAFILLAVLAGMGFGAAGWLFQDYLLPRSFCELLYEAEGGTEAVFQPEQVLSYGSGPPAMDGQIWEEPLTEEIRSLLEGHRYRKAWTNAPGSGGVTFECWDGCIVSEPAYWDGKYLWIWGREGCIPYAPSAGFGAEVERLLNTKYNIKALIYN